MKLKNYTSSVPVSKTVAQIEAKLAACKVSGIMKLYDPAGRVSSITFGIELGQKTYHVRMPANSQRCFEAMWRDYCSSARRPREDAKPRIMDQAERTAWRIVQEWIEIQLSLIQMNQAEFLEVFMPYIWDGKQTFFEYHQANQFKLLPESTE